MGKIKLGLLLTIFILTDAGHIFVEDPQLKWQNSGYLNSITIRFAL